MSEASNHKIIVGVLAVLLISIIVYLVKPDMFISSDKPKASENKASENKDQPVTQQPSVQPVIVQPAPVVVQPAIPQSPPLIVQPTPVVQQPAPQQPPTVVAMPTVDNIQKIVIYKDFSNSTLLSGEKVMHLAEVEIYDKNGRKLAFSEVEVSYVSRNITQYPTQLLFDNNLDNYSHSIEGLLKPTITIKLKTPQPLRSIVIYNRKSCCQNRLTDAILEIYDTNNKVYKTKTLSADLRQELIV